MSHGIARTVPTPEPIRLAVADLVHALGAREAARRLGVARHTALALACGAQVMPGSLALAREAMTDSREPRSGLVVSAFDTMAAAVALRDDRELDSAELRVALMLVAFADADGVATVGVRPLARAARTSPGAVRRCLAGLAERGPIAVRAERVSGPGSSSDTTRYHLSIRSQP